MKRSWPDRLRRLVASHDRNEAEDLAERAVEAGCVAIVDAGVRERVSVMGVVSGLSTDDRGWPHVELTDATGTVTLVWMGNQRLAAITPQSHLIASGRLTLDGDHRVIFNPCYQVIG